MKTSKSCSRIEDIESDIDINAVTSKQLRARADLNQDKFWAPAHVPKGRGCFYETGRTSPIPAEVRRLIYLHYVVGVPVDATPSELNGVASKVKASRAMVGAARKKLEQAGDLASQARELITKASAELDA